MLGDFSVAHSVRKLFYNWMIDLFWIGFFITTVFLVAAGLGWDGKHMTGSFWFGLVLGAIFCLIIVILGLISRLREERR